MDVPDKEEKVIESVVHNIGFFLWMRKTMKGNLPASSLDSGKFTACLDFVVCSQMSMGHYTLVCIFVGVQY